MTKSSWAKTVQAVLQDLGGDVTPVTGTKLRQHLADKTVESITIISYLESTGQRFRGFLEELEGVDVRLRDGMDMLVGLEGASWPSEVAHSRTTTTMFRPDVYAALTLVARTPYYHIPSTDEFLPSGEDHADAVPLPLVTLEGLVEQRRNFALTVQDPTVKKQLQSALDTAVNLLGAFYQQIVMLRLTGQWHRFKFDLLNKQLHEWAGQNGVTISPGWYGQSAQYVRDSPQQILIRLSQLMSDQEVRGLNVPFRAVEALYRSLAKGTHQ